MIATVQPINSYDCSFAVLVTISLCSTDCGTSFLRKMFSHTPLGAQSVLQVVWVMLSIFFVASAIHDQSRTYPLTWSTIDICILVTKTVEFRLLLLGAGLLRLCNGSCINYFYGCNKCQACGGLAAAAQLCVRSKYSFYHMQRMMQINY